MTILDIYRTAVSTLNNKTESLMLIKEIFDIGRLDIILNPDLKVSETKKLKFLKYLKKVQIGEPIQYVLGKSYFLNFNLTVGKGVFIPRPETEFLVDYVCENYRQSLSGNIIDLCAGSGAIGIALKKHFEKFNVWAVEKSKKAFEYLMKNVNLNDVKINCVLGDIFEKYNNFEDEFFDIIISNPPYVRKNDICNLEKNVQFEPKIALDGGEDGMDFYKRIIDCWTPKLKKNAVIIFEIGMGQHKFVKNIMELHKLANIKILKDFSGIERVISGQRQY